MRQQSMQWYVAAKISTHTNTESSSSDRDQYKTSKKKTKKKFHNDIRISFSLYFLWQCMRSSSKWESHFVDFFFFNISNTITKTRAHSGDAIQAKSYDIQHAHELNQKNKNKKNQHQTRSNTEIRKTSSHREREREKRHKHKCKTK